MKLLMSEHWLHIHATQTKLTKTRSGCKLNCETRIDPRSPTPRLFQREHKLSKFPPCSNPFKKTRICEQTTEEGSNKSVSAGNSRCPGSK